MNELFLRESTQLRRLEFKAIQSQNWPIQEAQLSQRGRAMPRVVEYFRQSLKAAVIRRSNTVTFANVGSVRLPSLKFVDFVYSADSVQTCDDWYTNGHFCCFDCLLTVFDEWYSVPIVKNTQNRWYTNRHKTTKTVPTVYQSSKTVTRQSKQQK